MTIAANINEVKPVATSTTHNITFTLTDDSTVTVTPSTELNVNEGDVVLVTLNWPPAWGTNCACTLTFTSGQDPFNDVDNGVTSFSVPDSGGTVNLTVQNDATIETDTYTVTMAVGTHTGSLDPKIKVGGGTAPL